MATALDSFSAGETSAPDSASLAIIRLYEIVSLLLFLGGALYVWRSKNPVFYGVYLASALGGGVMEWVFDSKYYFRLTTDERFITAWTIAGEKAAAAMILFYSFFFGIPVVLLRDNCQVLNRNLGHYGTYLFSIALGFFGTPLFECTNTYVAHIYKYHQRDEYLFYGMPYSNFWFGALMMSIPYWGLEKADVLVRLIPRTSLAPWEQKLMASGIGFAVVITSFFVAATINGVWYANAGDIWIPTPREF